MAKRLFLSAGEPSGDLHAANLARELQSADRSVECVGFGGPQMEQAGCRLLYPLTNLALMWFVEVGLNLHRFAGLLVQADRFFRRYRPDGVVLIDFPGFNWWVARRAHAQGIPVFYYVPPQLWAWAPWRVRKMRRLVDHVLCSLPFEQGWYEQRGVRAATYVGHPYFDEIAGALVDEEFLRHMRRPGQTKRRATVALLPGSRRSEVTDNFPLMLDAVRRLRRKLPEARFLVACFKQEHRAMCAGMLDGDGLPVELYVAKTREIIRASDVCVAVSGSVGLELLYETTPTVVVYKVSTRALYASRVILRTPFISLVNLLAEEELFPEYLTDRDDSEAISGHLHRWLTDRQAYGDAIGRLEALKQRAAHPGASARAAEYILSTLRRDPRIPSPHYRRSGAPAERTNRWKRLT